MTAGLTDLTALLKLEQVDELIFESLPADYPLPRVFGGQVVGLAVAASARTVPTDWSIHSVQSQFLRPGRAGQVIRFVVTRTRDGASFASRSIDAYQSDKLIFTARASFHRDEHGFDHQMPAPAAPAPDTVPSVVDLYHAEPGLWPEFYLEWGPLEIRIVPDADVPAIPTSTGVGSRGLTWMRANKIAGGEAYMHRALLACISDLLILPESVRPHGVPSSHPGVQTASLDHCVWFHRDFRVDEWLLYDHMSPSAHGGLGFCRGEFFDSDGVHVASVVQEGLIRPI
ncbi:MULTISPECIES: acyl-CoA thioesterase [unclassified Rhodococcus (in: high G+C Gram-positive bacteria)]|uniref:acyl-CoA thioesterase n=1 Tax=unclassified Rhodococcus (in: high G+C Gram-positive bacteria) TaxID=192944 RepID=UPI00092C4498|nr:acyl-CoA thioesterase domain-containing protein [Rhodococcus sp. M8]OLL20275.1 hypothetical protein BKE56_010095 [Rhodococcus sp. M8]QPG44130.1 thioesterase family protein [Rhodococcus sp. M8]